MATKKESDHEISDLFIRTGRLQFCVIALILSGFAIFGKAFITLWAGADYELSYSITLIFFAVLLCPLIQNVGITILLARGQMKFRSLCYLAIAVLSLGAQILLGRNYGALGCAWAVAGALFAGQWVAMNIYYRKRQHLAIGLFWREIAKMAIMPAILTVIGILLIHYFNFNSWLNLGIGIAIFLIIYLPLIWKFSMGQYERSQLTAPLKRLGIYIS